MRKIKWFAQVPLIKPGLVAVGMFLATSSAVATVRYVNINSTNATLPYTNWATAAGDIQDAVDAAAAGDEILVTNGLYYVTRGEVDPNGDYRCVVVDKPLTLQSVNGPDVTTIEGGGLAAGGWGCVYLTNNSVMVGFTLTGGVAQYGGGACGGTLNNCTLTGNVAFSFPVGLDGAMNIGGGACDSTLNNCTVSSNQVLQTGTDNVSFGGGAGSCTLNNCTLTGNVAGSDVNLAGSGGGGAAYCTLNNCTLTGNSATAFDAAYQCTLNNCIVYSNSANACNGSLNYCCTTNPLFVDYAHGNFHLQSSSPCINAGNNAYVVGGTDLDGHPRIVGGTVDIGAYECQSPALIAYFTWLQGYDLSTYAGALYADLDGTGMNLYQDWIAGLNPTNALSVLQMLAPVKTNNPAGLVVTWQSVDTRTYCLQRSTNLAAQPAFTTVQSNLVGQAGTTSWTDTNAVGPGPFFYRVGVGN